MTRMAGGMTSGAPCRRFLDDPLLPRNCYRDLLFREHYLVIYRVRGPVVEVDLVVDCRQDYGWLLRRARE